METDAVPTVDPIPLEVLEHKLTSRAAELAAAEAEWMGWLVEYDQRQGWAEWECQSAAHWLSWRCGLSPSAARERVRVANALTELPLIDEEFRVGRLSYSKVQALTRVANEHNEAHLCSLALHATGAQLAKVCAGYRSSAESDAGAGHALAVREWRTRPRYDGTTEIILRVADVEVAMAKQHVESETQRIIDDAVAASEEADDPAARLTRRQAIVERGGIAAIRADAAIALLTGEAEATEPTPADVALIVDADQPAVADLVDTESLASVDAFDARDACAQVPRPPATRNGETSRHTLPTERSVDPPTDTCAQACGPHDHSITVQLYGRAVAPTVGERLLCDPRVQALIESAEHGPLAVGRSTRFINRRLRRALERRDHGICQFPGCHATRRLHAHHILHWLHGGPTELDNLILVCHFHHHVLHEGGWNVDRATRRFIRPDGTCVEPNELRLRAGVDDPEPPTWPAGSLGPLEPPDLDRLDLNWTVAELHHNERVTKIDAGLPDPWGDTPVWAQ